MYKWAASQMQAVKFMIFCMLFGNLLRPYIQYGIPGDIKAEFMSVSEIKEGVHSTFEYIQVVYK